MPFIKSHLGPTKLFVLQLNLITRGGVGVINPLSLVSLMLSLVTRVILPTLSLVSSMLSLVTQNIRNYHTTLFVYISLASRI